MWLILYKYSLTRGICWLLLTKKKYYMKNMFWKNHMLRMENFFCHHYLSSFGDFFRFPKNYNFVD